jgi:hypothetical protein
MKEERPESGRRIPMRTLLFLALSLPLIAQDAPDTPSVPDRSFTFDCTQGWEILCSTNPSFTAEIRRNIPTVTSVQLLEDVTLPRLTGSGLDRDEFNTSEWSEWELDTSRRRWTRQRGVDPLNLKGNVILHSDGTTTFHLDSMKYWNMSTSWDIRFGKRRIQARHVAGAPEWSGLRKRWADKLPTYLARYRRALLRIATPKAEVPRDASGVASGASGEDPEGAFDAMGGVLSPVMSFDTIGAYTEGGSIHALELAAKEAGMPMPKHPTRSDHLYLLSALEEQYAALVIAELDGRRLNDNVWNEVKEKHSPRIMMLVRQILGRISAQCSGESRPAEEVVKQQPWDESSVAIPTFSWNTMTKEKRAGMLDAARSRLIDLSEASRTKGAKRLPRSEWETALLAELRKLNTLLRVHDREEGNSDLTHMRWPVIVETGKKVFNYRESTLNKQRKSPKQRVTTTGSARELVIFFFDTGQSRYIPGKVEYHTWYQGTVAKN